MRHRSRILSLVLTGMLVAFLCCESGKEHDDDQVDESTDGDDSTLDDDDSITDDDDSVADDDSAGIDDDDTMGWADVLAVVADGETDDYTFSVTIQSPDTGCDQYADWWEVLSPAGELVYRRILDHSHVDEQPFTRDDGPVPVQPGDVLIVRAHMNPFGYGGAAMQGSVLDGFIDSPDIPPDFAEGVENEEPLPDGCLF